MFWSWVPHRTVQIVFCEGIPKGPYVMVPHDGPCWSRYWPYNGHHIMYALFTPCSIERTISFCQINCGLHRDEIITIQSIIEPFLENLLDVRQNNNSKRFVLLHSLCTKSVYSLKNPHS